MLPDGQRVVEASLRPEMRNELQRQVASQTGYEPAYRLWGEMHALCQHVQDERFGLRWCPSDSALQNSTGLGVALLVVEFEGYEQRAKQRMRRGQPAECPCRRVRAVALQRFDG